MSAVASSYSALHILALEPGTCSSTISAVCAEHQSIVANNAGVVCRGWVGCKSDFLRKILVMMYGEAHRNSELPGSVRYTSSKSQATDAGMMSRR